jgi:hypothetical protein
MKNTKTVCFALILILCFSFLVLGLTILRTTPKSVISYHFYLPKTAVESYGFYYPVTFVFSIPNDTSLFCYYRYNNHTLWNQLLVKSIEDFFNNIEEVRFDKNERKAYVSVSFNGHTDLYIQFINYEKNLTEINYLV